MGALDWVYNNYRSYVKKNIGKPQHSITKRPTKKRIPNTTQQRPNTNRSQSRNNNNTITSNQNESNRHTHRHTWKLWRIPTIWRRWPLWKHPKLGFHNTFIWTRVKGYIAQSGGRVVIHSHIMDKKTEDFVPIGKVNARIETWGIRQAVEVQHNWAENQEQ